MILDKGERWRVVEGDALAVLAGLPDACVNCCVTSPPYYSLRDYGHPGQMGMEPRHDCAGWATGERCGACYVCRMNAVFEEVRRVLTDDGTCWLNVGDSFATQPGKGGNTPQTKHPKNTYPESAPHRSISLPGTKPKDLLMVPARLALSLQAAGWYVRCDIIWAKGNPMPESVTDRPTKAHEYLWLLSKSPRYHYDASAIAEPFADERNGFAGEYKNTYDALPERFGKREKGLTKPRIATTRNKRSVWTVNPRPFPGAHFAVYPPELVQPCIRAGCPVGGVVIDPFTGSGTTGCVAVSEGRRFFGVELNPQYAQMARGRIAAAQPSLFSTPAAEESAP